MSTARFVALGLTAGLAGLATGCGGAESLPICTHCSSGDDTSMTGDDSPYIDAGVDATTSISGRVCLLGDLRAPATCAASGAQGITVKLGDQTTTSGTSSGEFLIDPPTGAHPVWTVSGANLVTSVVPFDDNATTFLLPVIDADDYLTLQTNNGVVGNLANGDVVAVIKNGLQLRPAFQAVSDPAAAFDTLYSTDSATEWGTTETDAHGVAWINGIPAGSTTINVFPTADDTDITGFTPVPVQASAITYIVLDIPN